MLHGIATLTSEEEAQIKIEVRARPEYAAHSEGFNSIDAILLTDKREGLQKDATLLALYNQCNRDIDAAKKVALKKKYPQNDSVDLEAVHASRQHQSLHFAYSTNDDVAPARVTGGVRHTDGDVYDVPSTTKVKKKKSGCAIL